MKKILLSIILILGMTGCGALSTGQTTSDILETTSGLLYYYEDGDVVEFLNRAPLTEEENQRIAEALERLDNAREHLSTYRESPEQLITDIDLIANEYVKLKMAYTDVREIALKYQDEYNNDVWRSLEMFDSLAVELDNRFQELQDKSDRTAAINNAITFASIILRMAATL